MKKLFLTIALVIAAFSMNAQSQKPVMYAGFFNWNQSTIDYDFARRVRSSILEGFTATGRFEILDEQSESQLKKEAQRRSSESAMADETSLTEQIQDVAAQYILHGDITQCEAVPPTGDSQFYTGNISFTIKVNETKTKKLVASAEISIKDLKAGMGSTAQEAITDALKMVKGQIQDFVDKNFKLKAVIIHEDYTAKGSKLTGCYVTLGSDHGVEKGQKLNVYVANMIAGRETKKKIGSLSITEVMAGDLSSCKVTDGGEELLNALKEYIAIYETSPDKAKALNVETAEKSAASKLLRDVSSSFLK